MLRSSTRTHRRSIAAVLILFTVATGVRADNLDVASPPQVLAKAVVSNPFEQKPIEPEVIAKAVDNLVEKLPVEPQALYKGVVGNLLDQMPIEPEERVKLQRGNAVISNTLSGRSLAMLIGMATPVGMLAGLAWGIWAATKIAKPAAIPTRQPMSVAAASLSQSDVVGTGQDRLDAAHAALHRPDEQILQTAAAPEPHRTSMLSGRIGELQDGLCSDSAANRCEGLEELFQPLLPKKARRAPADQARFDEGSLALLYF